MDNNIHNVLWLTLSAIFFASALTLAIFMTRIYVRNTKDVSKAVSEKQSIVQQGDIHHNEEDITLTASQVFSSIMAMSPGVDVEVGGTDITGRVYYWPIPPDQIMSAQAGNERSINEIQTAVNQFSKYKRQDKFFHDTISNNDILQKVIYEGER